MIVPVGAAVIGPAAAGVKLCMGGGVGAIRTARAVAASSMVTSSVKRITGGGGGGGVVSVCTLPGVVALRRWVLMLD